MSASPPKADMRGHGHRETLFFGRPISSFPRLRTIFSISDRARLVPSRQAISQAMPPLLMTSRAQAIASFNSRYSVGRSSALLAESSDSATPALVQYTVLVP